MPMSAATERQFQPLPFGRQDTAGSPAAARVSVFARTLDNNDREVQARAAAEARKRAAMADPETYIAILTQELDHLRASRVADLAQARADGFGAGLEQARQEQTAALLSAVDALHAGVEALEDAAAERQAAIVADAAVLALDAADRLAGVALARQPLTAVQTALQSVLDESGWSQALTMTVHPSLTPALGRHLDQLAAGTRPLAVQIVPDTTLALGDARIEWPGGGVALDRAQRRNDVLAALATVVPDLTLVSEAPPAEVTCSTPEPVTSPVPGFGRSKTPAAGTARSRRVSRSPEPIQAYS